MKVEGAPADFVIPFLLGGLSSAGGRGLEVESFRGKYSRPNLFVILEAGSGIGKSVVGDQIFRPHYDFEQERRLAFQEDELPNLRAKLRILEAKLAKAEKKENPSISDLTEIERQKREFEKRKSGPRYLVEDCTQEALEQIISQQDGVVSLISTDARKVVKNVLGRHRSGSSEEDIFLKGWSGDNFCVDRIGRQSIPPVRNTCLSMFLALQPDLFQKLVRLDFVDSGFLPRLLLAHGSGGFQSHSSRGCDPEAESGYRSWLREAISFYNSQSEPFRFPMSHIAREILETFRKISARRAEAEPALAACYRRWAEQACRIAVCLQIARLGANAHTEPLLPECAEKAVDLMCWFGQQQRDLLIGITEEGAQLLTEKLINLVHQHPEGISLRYIYKKLRIPKAEALSLVANTANLEISKTKTGGRPTEMIKMKNATPGL